jgi:hypothetical protein
MHAWWSKKVCLYVRMCVNTLLLLVFGNIPSLSHHHSLHSLSYLTLLSPSLPSLSIGLAIRRQFYPPDHPAVAQSLFVKVYHTLQQHCQHHRLGYNYKQINPTPNPTPNPNPNPNPKPVNIVVSRHKPSCSSATTRTQVRWLSTVDWLPDWLPYCFPDWPSCLTTFLLSYLPSFLTTFLPSFLPSYFPTCLTF